MRRIPLFVLAIGLLVPFLGAAPASAQATRTWVSGVGDDVNPCSRTAPCKTFAGAISKTAPGGEINCLDPAGFGAVTITKSMTIDCTGMLGGILASSTTGVIINGAGAIVTLRALEINGGPPNLPGVNGVRYLQGARLNIEDCTIYNFLGAAPNGNGIIINNTSGVARLHVSNTVIRNNGNGSTGAGIKVNPQSGGAAQVTLQRVNVTGNTFGIAADGAGNTAAGGINMTIKDSVMASNDNDGLIATTPAGGAPIGVLVSNTVSANNAFGIRSIGTNVTVRVNSSDIAGNGTGLSFSGGGALLSAGNNTVQANGTNASFSGSYGLQ